MPVPTATRSSLRTAPEASDDSALADAHVATADGLVLELSAEYVHESTGERVRVAFRYDRLDDTAVVSPAWYWDVESDDGTTD